MTLSSHDIVLTGVVAAVAGAFFVNVGRLSGASHDESGRRMLRYAWTVVAMGCGAILLGLLIGSR